MAPVFVLFHVFVSYVLLATNVGVLATAPKEKKVDDMAETRERGFATARKFRAGGCCQICETKFYRELAFLEVSEDHKLETVSRFHTWNSYGSPVDNFHKPVLHEELQRHYKPTKDRLADLHSTFLELNKRLKKENLFRKGYSAAANTLHLETSIKGSLKAAKGAKKASTQQSASAKKGSSKREKGSNSAKKSSKSTKKSSGSSEKATKKESKSTKKGSKTESKSAKKGSKNEKKASKAKSKSAKKASKAKSKSAKKASKAKSKAAKKASKDQKKASAAKSKADKKASKKAAKSVNDEVQLAIDKASGGKKAGKAGKAGKTKKSPALAQSTNTIAPTPCCSICAADFLPAPDSATMQDRENFMNPDPKLGWIYGKDEPVPCCKVCDSSHYPNLDYSEVLDTRTSQAFIEINSPEEKNILKDLEKSLDKFVTSTSKSKTDRIMSENAKRTRKLRKMMKKKAEGGGKGASIPYLDSHHCSKIHGDKSKTMTCVMCPAEPPSSFYFSDPRGTKYQEAMSDPQRESNLKHPNPNNFRSYSPRNINGLLRL